MATADATPTTRVTGVCDQCGYQAYVQIHIRGAIEPLRFCGHHAQAVLDPSKTTCIPSRLITRLVDRRCDIPT